MFWCVVTIVDIELSSATSFQGICNVVAPPPLLLLCLVNNILLLIMMIYSVEVVSLTPYTLSHIVYN